MVEGDSPLEDGAVVARFHGEVIGGVKSSQWIQFRDSGAVVGGSAAAVAHQPRIRPVNAGDSRSFVEKTENVIVVEEKLVESGGEVTGASGRNELHVSGEALFWKQSIRRKIEALPEDGAGFITAAVTEDEVTGVEKFHIRRV